MLQPCDPPTHPDPMGGPQRRTGRGTCPPLGLGRLPVSAPGTQRPCPSAQDPVCRGLGSLALLPTVTGESPRPRWSEAWGPQPQPHPRAAPSHTLLPLPGMLLLVPGAMTSTDAAGLSGSVLDRLPWAGISPTTQGNARRRPLTLKPHMKYLGVKSMPAAVCCKILPERKKVHTANHGPPGGRVRRTLLVRLKVDRPPLNPGAVYTSVTHPQQSAGKAGTAPHPAEPEAGWRSTQAQALLLLAWKRGWRGGAGWELRVLPVHGQPETRAEQAPEHHQRCFRTGARQQARPSEGEGAHPGRGGAEPGGQGGGWGASERERREPRSGPV